MNSALDNFVVLPIWNISDTRTKSELEIRIIRNTTASIAIVPSRARKNFPTIVDTFLWLVIIFLISAAIVKMQVNPIAKMKIHQKIVFTVLSPARNSMIFTLSPR